MTTVDLQLALTVAEEDRRLLIGQQRILEKIAGGETLAATFNDLLLLIEEYLPASAASILLLKEGKTLHFCAGPHIPKAYVDAIDGLPIGPSEGSCGTAAYSRQTVISKDVLSDLRWKDFRDTAANAGFRACWSVPIISVSQGVLGTFAIYFPVVCEPSALQLERVKSFAHLAGVALERHSYEANLVSARNAAENAAREKSRFLANMSHEIRTPMNGIIGLTDLLLSSNLTSAQREHMELVRDSCECLLDIINDILNFSKIEAGKLQVVESVFSIRDLIKNSVALSAVALSQKDVEISTEIAADIPEYLFGDAARVRQVVNNLLGNATKFTERGEIVISLSARDRKNENVVLELSVTDSGIGIPAERIGLIFEPFTQAHSAMSERYGGTGLGLAITKMLLQEMGGEIRVESQVGVGSVFNAWWTTKIASDDLVRAFIANAGGEVDSDPQNIGDPELLAGVRILVGEDNEVNAALVRAILEGVKARVTIVKNGLQVIEALEKDDFDLVVIDCQMPELGGAEATSRIRKGGKRYASIPIIGVTANGMPENYDNCLAAGMNDCLIKPIDRMPFLLRVVRQLRRPIIS